MKGNPTDAEKDTFIHLQSVLISMMAIHYYETNRSAFRNFCDQIKTMTEPRLAFILTMVLEATSEILLEHIPADGEA